MPWIKVIGPVMANVIVGVVGVASPQAGTISNAISTTALIVSKETLFINSTSFLIYWDNLCHRKKSVEHRLPSATGPSGYLNSTTSFLLSVS
jgi:hypothetical protein